MLYAMHIESHTLKKKSLQISQKLFVGKMFVRNQANKKKTNQPVFLKRWSGSIVVKHPVLTNVNWLQSSVYFVGRSGCHLLDNVGLPWVLLPHKRCPGAIIWASEWDLYKLQ